MSTSSLQILRTVTLPYSVLVPVLEYCTLYGSPYFEDITGITVTSTRTYTLCISVVVPPNLRNGTCGNRTGPAYYGTVQLLLYSTRTGTVHGYYSICTTVFVE